MRNKTEYRQNVQKSVSMIYEINHIWTSEMKWKWRNDRRSERNLWSHWLHSSVGRASHRYREVTGSNPVEVLNIFFFQASLRNCINCVHWTIISSFSKISFIYRKTTERASKQPVFNLILDLHLWSIDSCLKRVSTEQYLMSVTQDHVYNSLRWGFFLLSSPLTRFWFSLAHVLSRGVQFTSWNYSIKTFLQRFHESFAFGPG